MSIRVKVGACVNEKKYLQRFKEENLGDFMSVFLPRKKEDAIFVAKFCRRNKIYFKFHEVTDRKDYGVNNNPTFLSANLEKVKYFYTPEDLKEIIDEGGVYYLGRTILGESGGMLYWPKEYLIDRAEESYINLPFAKNMKEAKDRYIEFIKDGVNFEKRLGGGPFWNVDSSIIFKYHLEAGIDIANLESLPGDPNLMYAAVRGASRAYGIKDFAAHIAMSCYGGAKVDEIWFKRWKVSLYFSYLSGANFIFSENGQFSNDELFGNNYKFNSPQCSKMRQILCDFYKFCQRNPRPENGPLVKVGFIHGNLDGFPGLWSNWVWGQFKDKSWQHEAPEFGWEYLNNLYRKDEWFTNTLVGNNDLSGNPPYGQFDVLPVEVSQEILNKYTCLIFLGWNTMTTDIYEKLKRYVANGGHLIISLPHLSTSLDRKEDLKLYKNGDFSDLFGVEIKGKAKDLVTGIKFTGESSLYNFPDWSLLCDPKCINRGFPVGNLKLLKAKVLAVSSCHFFSEREKFSYPVLVENSFGKGKAILINSWCYPGVKDMNLFMREIIRAVMIGEHDDNLKVIVDDKVRYAIYEEKGKKILYLLNTDFDLRSECCVLYKNKTIFFLLKPTDIKIVEL